MGAALKSARARPRIALAAGLLAAAYVATRLALLWRFPWFVDETTFADFARTVHGAAGQLFVAEGDKKGLLPSWLGAALIGGGVGPVTAMRLLAAAGAALAALCGGILMRLLYGLREGLVTAGLIALGPYFLVTASVGIYDALVTGIVAAGVLVSLWLVVRPRPYTALLLGLILGAGGLTKPTTWVAVVVLPFTLLLFDWTSAARRRRLLIWGANALLAVVVGYALTSIARFSPLYDQPIREENHRGVSQLFDDFWPTVRTNGPPLWDALHGYLTYPGIALALVGAVVAVRRSPAAAAILGIWTVTVLVSALLLTLHAYPRYFAAAIVPLSGLIALGAFALGDALLAAWGRRAPGAAIAVGIAAALALLPAVVFDARVLADPVGARYPALDEDQYVLLTSAQSPVPAVARAIERRGGPYPVWVDVGLGYPWGLSIELNGAGVPPATRFRVFSYGTPQQLAATRFLVTDGATSDASPRPGFRLIGRYPRPRDGAVMRLYARVRA